MQELCALVNGEVTIKILLPQDWHSIRRTTS